MSEIKTIEIPIEGMDCADCTRHVHKALASLAGVQQVEVFLATEKAVVQLDPQKVALPAIRLAVQAAGYQVGASAAGVAQAGDGDDTVARGREFTRQVLAILGVTFGAVLFVVVIGEWLGLFETLTSRVPWPLGLAIVLLVGYPVFRNVIRAALNRQVIAHTLMSVGVVAALVVGEWATAAVVVFFMRIGDFVEHFTAERARRAVKSLSELAPQTARLLRGADEFLVPIAEVQPGDIVVVRPGEQIPVDGEVVAGQATVDQATITGESMPVESGPGARVYAATLVSLGSLRVRTIKVGGETTFGRVVKLVEEAEAHRADVQRVADVFSAYYLPVVAGIAVLTFLIRRDPLATAAVLVVACSCSFALATPIAMLASIGAAARRGVMIKGGKYLELLAKADTMFIDKTGTLTLGEPQITDVIVCAAWGENTGERSLTPAQRLLVLAGTAERYSEHPLAEAVRRAAVARGCELGAPHSFDAQPGRGVSARVGGSRVWVGRSDALPEELRADAQRLRAQGKSLLYVTVDEYPAGLLAAADTLRAEVPAALEELHRLGIREILLLTGDNSGAAGALAGQLGIPFRAELLPEDKIALVRQYQQAGHKVVMIGDGVNDAPALAQAEVGIAIGAAGRDVAIQAGHIALMRVDWNLVPEVIRIARRTMRIVHSNIGFTAAYNVIGLSLAAMGILPPILAAAAQSLPDLGILGNSARLLRNTETLKH